MRLRKINEQLLEILEDLEYNPKARNTNPQTYQVDYISYIKYAIRNLEKLKLFPEIINELKELSFYISDSNSDTLIIDSKEHSVLSKNIPFLILQCEALSDSIEKSIPETNPNTITVKIPTPLNFKDLKESIDKIDKIFSQTILHKDINGTIQISNFDTGSYWIEFIAGAKEAIALIGGIAWSAVVVYKKLQEGKLLKEQVTAMKISNDAFKEIVAKSKDQINEISQKEAEYISSEYYKSNDPEQIGRIKMSIKELAELYTKGAKVYPSIEANEDVIDNFPDFEKIAEISSKVKKITAKK